MLHLVVAGTELGDDDPFILYWYCLLWLHSQVYNILKTGGEDGKIQMWKDTPLDSSGFKDVSGCRNDDNSRGISTVLQEQETESR